MECIDPLQVICTKLVMMLMIMTAPQGISPSLFRSRFELSHLPRLRRFGVRCCSGGLGSTMEGLEGGSQRRVLAQLWSIPDCYTEPSV